MVVASILTPLEDLLRLGRAMLPADPGTPDGDGSPTGHEEPPTKPGSHLKLVK